MLTLATLVLLLLFIYTIDKISKYIHLKKVLDPHPTEIFSAWSIVVFLKNYFTHPNLAYKYLSKELAIQLLPRLAKHNYFMFWVVNYPVLIVNKAHNVELIAKNSLDKGFLLSKMKPFFTDGLVASGYPKWKKFRKLIQPSFHSIILSDFIPIMQHHGNQLVKTLYNHCDIVTDPEHLIERTTFNVLCETAMGVSTENDSRVENLLEINILARDFIIYRYVTPFFWSDNLFNLYLKIKIKDKLDTLENLTKEILHMSIERQRTNLSNVSNTEKPKKLEREIFINHLAKIYLDGLNNPAKPNITIDNMYDEINNFVVAGFETVHSGIMWTLYCFGLNKKIQDQVYEEINSVLPKDGDLTMNDLSNLTYLEMCIKETLRMFPPVTVIPNQTHKEFKIDGKTVPAGIEVVFLPWLIHHDPEIYNNPYNYDPDRFLPENADKIPPGGYIPFGSGPRLCIGYRYAMIEMKTIISQVVRHFEITTTKPLQEIGIYVPVTLKPLDPLYFKFTPRNRI